jgi:hypothetical protein
MELYELQELRAQNNRTWSTMVSNDDESKAHDDIINKLCEVQSILDTLIERDNASEDLHQKLSLDLAKTKGISFVYGGYQVIIHEHSEGWEFSIAPEGSERDGGQLEGEIEGGIMEYSDEFDIDADETNPEWLASCKSVVANVLEGIDNL